MQSVNPTDYLQLVHTIRQSNQNLIYIFNQGENDGFIIASGDDRVMPILGYSDTGSFDADNMSDNFRYWLECYEKQIKYAIDNDLSINETSQNVESEDYAPIGPLITTLWGQREPYNAMCPIDPETGERCVTGCVATAVAQILNYHQWPDKGVGEYTYKSKEHELFVNFGETEYQWDKMLDDYDETSPQESKDAVAELMLHCGILNKLGYGSEETGGGYLPEMIEEYLKYSYVEHDGSDNSMNILYKELEKAQPVLCCASSSETKSSHAFVCDGYSQKGYFHFNWGWDGNSDGYYLLSALNPTDSMHKFEDTLWIRPSIYPDNVIRESGDRIVLSNCKNEMIYDKSDEIAIIDNEIYNRSVEAVSGIFGINLTDDQGSEIYLESIEYSNLQPHIPINGFSMKTTDFPYGLFKGVYQFKETESDDWESFAISNHALAPKDTFNVVSDNKYLRFTYQTLRKTIPSCVITCAEYLGNDERKIKMSFNVSVGDNGDYIDVEPVILIYKINKNGRQRLYDSIDIDSHLYLIGTDTETINTEFVLNKPLVDNTYGYCVAIANSNNYRYSDFFMLANSNIETIENRGISVELINEELVVQSDDSIERVSVYSINGTELLNLRGDSSSVLQADLSSLYKGLYIVKAATATAEKTMKIVFK